MRQPPRGIDIGTHQDTFLVCAVVTIIVIRLQLWYTDYPQLGGGGLHIAHLLYGGAFMVLAIALLISYLGRPRRLPSAVLAGVGFGFFIDETGKFVTEDNDYFFQPTAAIIYVVFILLFFGLRHIRTRRGFTQREYLMNAIDLFGDAAGGRGLSEHDKARALDLLERARDEPLAQPVRDAIEAADAVPTPQPRGIVRWTRTARDRYFQATTTSWFRHGLDVAVALWVVVNIASVLVFGLVPGAELGAVQSGFDSDELGDLGFVNIASIVSAAVAQGLNVAGLTRLRRDRVGAYKMFERSLFVTLFVTQVFVFAESSFASAGGMIVTIALLVTVRYMIREEARRGVA